MFDDCSTDHYVTHDTAKKYNFPGREVDLQCEVLGGAEQNVSTMLYEVRLIDKKGIMLPMIAMGLIKLHPLIFLRKILIKKSVQSSVCIRPN